ncbi:MAG: hypothetical protein JO247_04695 [Chloroflexi bacterium]|nr:hypothetical protein [Chloroflexota bacterium]
MSASAPPGFRRRRSVVLPLALIGLGAIFLLQNFGVLSWQFWGSVWQYWPALLILVGLELVFGGRGTGWLLGFVVLVAIVGVAAGHFSSRVAMPAWFNRVPAAEPAASPIEGTTSQDLQGATQATVTLQFGAGDMTVGPLTDDPNLLSKVTYQGPESLEPKPTFSLRGGQASLVYKVSGGDHSGRFPFFNSSAGSQANFFLNPTIPLAVTVQEGATTSHLDLSQLKVSNLTLDTGASTTDITMPAQAGNTIAQIRGGAATINLSIPSGVAAQITYQGGLSQLNIDHGRFPQVPNNDHLYQSQDYANAQNKLDLTIQTGVATVNVS